MFCCCISVCKPRADIRARVRRRAVRVRTDETATRAGAATRATNDTARRKPPPFYFFKMYLLFSSSLFCFEMRARSLALCGRVCAAHAFRLFAYFDFTSEGKPRAATRARARRCVARARKDETATRVGVAIRATNDTAPIGCVVVNISVV